MTNYWIYSSNTDPFVHANTS